MDRTFTTQAYLFWPCASAGQWSLECGVMGKAFSSLNIVPKTLHWFLLRLSI
jgi:hypothetical protein